MALSVAGTAAIVFGKNRPHSRQLLATACENQGWKNVIRRPPSKHSALDASVRQVAKWMSQPQTAGHSSSLSVRALSTDLAFEAVRIVRGPIQNDATHLFSVGVDEDTDQVSVLSRHADVDGTQLRADVQKAYDDWRNTMSARQVSTVVDAVMRRLHGVALGGLNVYFLPHGSVQQWHHWRDDAQLWRYQSAAFEVASDPATVEHIISSLNEEVSVTSQEVIQSIEKGDLTPKAAKILARKAKAVIDKIKAYEAALGQQLEWMREPLEAAQNGLAVSSLLSVSV
jgi:hypothetical protein